MTPMNTNHRRAALFALATLALPGCSHAPATPPTAPVAAPAHRIVGACPISGSWVRDNEVQGRMSWKGKVYYFCTQNCRDQFAQIHPDAKNL